jgi:transposase
VTTRKTSSSEEKLRIVLKGIQSNANVEAICRAHGLHSAQFYKWKDQALGAMRAGLENHQGTPLQRQRQRQEMARLKRLIAEQAIALQCSRRNSVPSREKTTEAARDDALNSRGPHNPGRPLDSSRRVDGLLPPASERLSNARR